MSKSDGTTEYIAVVTTTIRIRGYDRSAARKLASIAAKRFKRFDEGVFTGTSGKEFADGAAIHSTSTVICPPKRKMSVQAITHWLCRIGILWQSKTHNEQRKKRDDREMKELYGSVQR